MKQVTVVGDSYDIDLSMNRDELSDYWGQGRIVGLTEFGPKKIYIANDQGPEARKSTFLHEILEIMKYALSLPLRERHIEKMEYWLYNTLDNMNVEIPEIE